MEIRRKLALTSLGLYKDIARTKLLNVVNKIYCFLHFVVVYTEHNDIVYFSDDPRLTSSSEDHSVIELKHCKSSMASF